MLMELLFSRSGSHLAKSPPSVIRELFVSSQASLLIDYQHSFEMHPHPDEQTFPSHAHSHELDHYPEGYHYEDEYPAMSNTTGAELHLSLGSMHSHTSSNHTAPVMAHDSPFRSHSADIISHSSYSAHLHHLYNTPMVPDLQPSLSCLPLTEVLGLNSALAPVVTCTSAGCADSGPFTHQHSFIKKEPLELHQKLPETLQNLPQSSPSEKRLELTSPFANSTLADMQHYPDMTTMVNSDTTIAAPMVETTFVDLKKCTVCGKRITRDMIRHMRTHQVDKRFNCMFPREICDHKSGKFNRRYDFKKHLLNKHFNFINPNVRKVHNLRDKLNDWGYCPCGRQFLSDDWLENHILTDDESKKCPMMTRH